MSNRCRQVWPLLALPWVLGCATREPEQDKGCPPGTVPYKTGCEADRDTDQIADLADNCPELANGLQADLDADGVGDVCDNCPFESNVDQLDSDADGVGDACSGTDSDGDDIFDEQDNCPQVYNPDQRDSDGDGEGDACEPPDADGDGIPDADDNCPHDANPLQADVEGDGVGDACADQDGTIGSPFIIPSDPTEVSYEDAQDTTASSSDAIDTYPPFSQNESGPEYVYVFRAHQPVYFRAWIETPEPTGVDIDLHLLSSLEPLTLLARDHNEIRKRLQPGLYYLVLDTYVSHAGTEKPGAYVLHVSIVPISASDFSFVVMGDNQFSTTSCTSGVPERLAIPEAILELSPTFILHVGDLMDHGYEEGAYEAFVGCYSFMLHSIPFFPTMGNHDAGSGAIWSYKDYLEEQLFVGNPASYGPAYETDFLVAYEDDPTPYCTSFADKCYLDVVPSGVSFKTFYAFKHRNAYFISFEQGTRWWSNTPTSWVETHLSQARADPDIDHIFVFLHHPFYSTKMAETSDSECIEPVRSAYEDLFRQYDVTMVFSGHTHVYEHFFVPDDGNPTRARPPPESYAPDTESIHYVISGGAGGPQPNSCTTLWEERQEPSYDYSQARDCCYHVVLVEVTGTMLTVSMIQVEGDKDDYSISTARSFVIH